MALESLSVNLTKNQEEFKPIFEKVLKEQCYYKESFASTYWRDAMRVGYAKAKFILDKDKFVSLESERKQVQSRTEELQAKRNQLAKAVGMKKGKGEDASAEIAESGVVNQELQSLTEKFCL